MLLNFFFRYSTLISVMRLVAESFALMFWFTWEKLRTLSTKRSSLCSFCRYGCAFSLVPCIVSDLWQL